MVRCVFFVTRRLLALITNYTVSPVNGVGRFLIAKNIIEVLMVLLESAARVAKQATVDNPLPHSFYEENHPSTKAVEEEIKQQLPPAEYKIYKAQIEHEKKLLADWQSDKSHPRGLRPDTPMLDYIADKAAEIRCKAVQDEFANNPKARAEYDSEFSKWLESNKGAMPIIKGVLGLGKKPSADESDMGPLHERVCARERLIKPDLSDIPRKEDFPIAELRKSTVHRLPTESGRKAVEEAIREKLSPEEWKAFEAELAREKKLLDDWAKNYHGRGDKMPATPLLTYVNKKAVELRERAFEIEEKALRNSPRSVTELAKETEAWRTKPHSEWKSIPNGPIHEAFRERVAARERIMVPDLSDMPAIPALSFAESMRKLKLPSIVLPSSVS